METLELTLAERGQIVIPKEARDPLGLKAGAKLQIRLKGGRLLIEKKVQLDLSRWAGKALDDGLTTRPGAGRDAGSASAVAGRTGPCCEGAAQVKAAVDTSILFDIVKSAPGAAAAQIALESALAQSSLTVCAVVVAELGRYFSDEQNLIEFLAACQIDHDPLSMQSALVAAHIMRGYAKNKGPRERVAPDFLIGAHAIEQADALLTTDAGFYRHYFKSLKVLSP